MTPSASTTHQDSYRGRGPHVALGFAVLGAAGAWALHLNLMYFLVQPVCRLGGTWTFHVASLVLLALSLLSGLAAWRIRRDGPRADDLPAELDARDGVLPFLGLFGIAAAAVFSLAIVVQWIPVLVIGPCE